MVHLARLQRRVLIVDDEAAILEALEDVLSMEGYTVSTALNGREGLRRMEEARPDVVLLDMMMPLVDGREMLRVVRNDPRLSATPVVLMSAGVVSSDDKVWVNGFLAKPFELDALLRALITALERPVAHA